MSDVEAASAGAQPETLHVEETDDQPKELGDYDVADAGDSDKDSDALSEVDEDQFDEYDPAAARIEEKPVEIDEDVARTLKAGKRKGQAVKKPKEGRRDKKRARGREYDEDNDGADGEILTGKRRKAGAATASKRKSPEPENEEHLTPEERRRRAIERAASKDVKKPSTRRRKKDEIDLEAEIDELLSELKVRMEEACRADNAARMNGQPAIHKLKLLPDVMSVLNRNNQQAAIVDPDSNFLQHVKFFLEPLSDGSLPAYTIQRDVFTALTRLPIEKETLLASEIGKVVLFYTKSKKPEVGIKRMAERLLGDWSRPILNRTDDYKKRHIQTREFDYQYVSLPRRFLVRGPLLLTTEPPPTEPPSSNRPRAPPSSPSASGRPPARSRRNARPSASASWPPPSRATAPASSACPRRTAWRPRAPSTPRAAPSTGPSAPPARPPSERSPSSPRRSNDVPPPRARSSPAGLFSRLLFFFAFPRGKHGTTSYLTAFAAFGRVSGGGGGQCIHKLWSSQRRENQGCSSCVYDKRQGVPASCLSRL